MKKVFQRIIDSKNGDCMKAAVATLFDEDYENVPHFISFGDHWWYEFKKYLKLKGYKEKLCLYNPIMRDNIHPDFSFERLKEFDGINGYFYATVCSPKYNPNGDIGGITHAVIIDKDFNVIHDPNPENINIKYPLHEEKYKGIRYVEIFEKIKINTTHNE